MKVRIDYDRSEVVAYQNDANHHYLKLTFIPDGMNMLMQSYLGNQATMQMNFYPQRDNEGNIDEDFEAAMLEAFENKALDKQPLYADRVQVAIPPTLMTYSSGANKGEVIMEGDAPRIYNHVTITCLTKIVRGEEVPAQDENALKTRALAIRRYRIEQGQWLEPADWSVDVAEEDPTDVSADEEPEAVQKPISSTTKPQVNKPLRH